MTYQTHLRGLLRYSVERFALPQVRLLGSINRWQVKLCVPLNGKTCPSRKEVDPSVCVCSFPPLGKIRACMSTGFPQRKSWGMTLISTSLRMMAQLSHEDLKLKIMARDWGSDSVCAKQAWRPALPVLYPRSYKEMPSVITNPALGRQAGGSSVPAHSWDCKFMKLCLSVNFPNVSARHRP